MKISRIKAGRYTIGNFQIVRDDEECSGTYRLWNVYEDNEWCIECSTLRDAIAWIQGRGC